MYLFIYVDEPIGWRMLIKIYIQPIKIFIAIFGGLLEYTQDKLLPLCSQCNVYRMGLESLMSKRRQPSLGNVLMFYINPGGAQLLWTGLIVLSSKSAWSHVVPVVLSF